MAQSPLVEAVKHFSLAQLMADPNLLRNVLNDIGAQPSESFLLAAALEARIPQTLIEHSSTNDLSVVEPRLVAALNERGVERSRAEWAVNAWKEVIGGSTLGLQTVRPDEPATVRPSQPTPVISNDPATVRPSQPAPAPQPRPVSTPPMPPMPPASQPAAVPMPREGRGRPRPGIIIATVIIALLVVGLVVWLARPSSKHSAASSTSSGPSAHRVSSPGPSTSTSAPPASPATSGSATPVANLGAPLGPAKSILVAGGAAWTNTGLKVAAGERVNITASGQILAGPGQPCGPDGITQTALDIFSLIGGGHVAALIGLVAGSGTPFLVGANYNGVAPAAGELYLGINDLGVDNNSGQFTALVRLQQS